MTRSNLQIAALKTCRGLIQAVCDIRIPILGTLIWACPNLIFSKIETTVKHNASFLIKSAMQSEHNNQKTGNKCNVKFVWTP